MGDAFACPQCGTALDATPGPAPQDVVCPHCGGLTLIPAADGSLTPLSETAAAEAHVEGRDAELSALRIRQLSGARRAAYRARSYCVVGALVCAVAVVQLAMIGIRTARTLGFGLRLTAYALAAVVAAWGAVYFFRKAMAFDREAKQSSLPEVSGEPDFSTLSDGSQRWKNLEDVR